MKIFLLVLFISLASCAYKGSINYEPEASAFLVFNAGNSPKVYISDFEDKRLDKSDNLKKGIIAPGLSFKLDRHPTQLIKEAVKAEMNGIGARVVDSNPDAGILKGKLIGIYHITI
jgi:hypothetical protein